jgi:hypothetical protein
MAKTADIPRPKQRAEHLLRQQLTASGPRQ